ncbi:MAG: GlsB/YeaQ/YmgE family stress response membrane protein [Verrucomicrobiota bacterium]
MAWIIAGGLVGSFTGLLVKRRKKGFGWLTNLGVGMSGALIGGLLFRVFGIDLGLSEIAISLEDLVAAFAGALLFLAGVYIYRRFFAKREQTDVSEG